jgi:hypothetical protein
MSRMPALIGSAMLPSTKRNAATRIQSVRTLGRITPSPRRKNRDVPEERGAFDEAPGAPDDAPETAEPPLEPALEPTLSSFVGARV